VHLRVFPDDRFGASAYRYRDDALITLSHARGLVDVGTVSIGASGARVEGFSAPLMFLLATVYYWLGGTRERLFLDAQVVVATALLGSSVFVALRLAAPRRRLLVTAAIASGAAVPLFATFPVFAWHASGMENAITNALVVASVAALAAAIERGRGYVAAGVVVGALSITRVEFVAHAAPLLLVAALVCRARAGSWRPVARLVAPAVVIWAGVNAARLLYFGSLTPNSGAAQRIAVGDNVGAWAQVLWPFAVATAVIGIATYCSRLSVEGLVRRWWFWTVLAAAAVSADALGRHAESTTALPGRVALEDAARVLGLWWWLAAAAALLTLAAFQGRTRLVHGLLLVPVLTGLGHILVFGPARLYGERVVTFVMVPLVVLVAASALAVDWSRFWSPSLAEQVAIVAAGVVCCCAVTGWWMHRAEWHAEVGLCCDPSELTPRILAAADTLGERTGLPTPMVANPDIGLLSLGKTVDVTDLGLLGDPLLRSVWNRATTEGRTDVAVDYLNQFAVPDVVEVHGVWMCQYADWLASPEFGARYRKVWDDGWSQQFAATACPLVSGVGGGIWVRDDFDTAPGAAEVRLSRQLARSPTAARVRDALATCRERAPTEPSGCQYVTRSVRRNLAAFTAAGTLDRTRDLFRGVTGTYDRALLSARDRGDWYEPASDALFALP